MLRTHKVGGRHTQPERETDRGTLNEGRLDRCANVLYVCVLLNITYFRAIMCTFLYSSTIFTQYTEQKMLRKKSKKFKIKLTKINRNKKNLIRLIYKKKIKINKNSVLKKIIQYFFQCLKIHNSPRITYTTRATKLPSVLS